MNDTIYVRAFAKINIGLKVGPRNQDGYHSIESIFQAVDLGDDLQISVSKGKGLEVRADLGCAPEQTTVYAAASAFLAKTKLECGISIEVFKRIPSMAGMGGGSADAAGTLAGLDMLLGTGFGAEGLLAIGEAVGSDVPFFLSGGTAFVEGRGEIVHTILPRIDLSFLLVKPLFGVSTPWAYKRLDDFRAARGLDPSRIPSGESPDSALRSLERPPETWEFANDFQAPLIDAFPEYSFILEGLKVLGASYVSLTGSGSAVYAVFRGRDACMAKGKAKALMAGTSTPNTLSGMGLHALKPLETSLVLSYYPFR
ncbi:MAG TPA: 4-(cytidine 5'-diphospho)-2-C-methyl-D-erythritol kinase [Rectinemataceae bacterium]